MNIGVFGAGYVGLVTSACLADLGHRVTCVDKNESRIKQLLAGHMPVYEPGLETIVSYNQNEKRLIFSADSADGIKGNKAVFIAVGTPPDPEGGASMQQVTAVAQSIGDLISSYTLVINKSTVPVGTGQIVSDIIGEELDKRQVHVEYDVASNPEFLKEGSAVRDFQRPDRIIIGCNSKRAEKLLRHIYSPYSRNHEKIMIMDRASAELTKYAANCMLATKITFINQIAAIAEASGANIEHIRRGIGSDKRIGYDFLYSGPGYGGSCFPKDIKALIATANNHQLDVSLLETVDRMNQHYKKTLNRKIYQYYHGQVKGKVLAIWGLAFKANTDDVRESASLELINWALQQGLMLRLYDPQAMKNAKAIYGEHEQIKWCRNRWDCLRGSDALVVCTEWQEFKAPDFRNIADQLSDKVIFDGRNIYIDENVGAYGLKCHFIGYQPLQG